MKNYIKNHVAFVTAAVMGVISAVTVFFYELGTYEPVGSRLFSMLSDSFFISAILLLLAGCVLLLHYLGLFDWISYLFAKLFKKVDDFSAGKKVSRKKRMTYYDYISSRTHSKDGFKAVLAWTGIYFLASLVFLAISSLV